MLCFKCLNQVPDRSTRCPKCGQDFTGRSSAKGIDKGPTLQEGEKVGHYEIRELVGEGPIGRLYKALDTQFDVLAALKIVYPAYARDRAVRATAIDVFRSLSEFESEGLVKVYDAFEAGDRLVIATDYLEGLTLRKLIEVRASTGGRFHWDEAEPIVEGICSALASLPPGDVHGDLKPENVLILPDAIRITDFGLARILEPDLFVDAQRDGGNAYLAPELLTHPERLLLDPAIDVYALGAILYHLLTGQVPGDNPELPSKLAPGVPDAVDRLVERALQPHPDRRFGHVAEFHLELARIAGKNEAAARAEIRLVELPQRPVFEQPPQQTPTKPASALFEDIHPADEQEAVSAPIPTTTIKQAELASSKSKLPLIAGVAVALLFVVGLVAWMLLGRAEKPTQMAQPKPVLPAAPTAVTQTAPKGPTLQEKTKSAFDRAEKLRDQAVAVNANKRAPDLFVAGLTALKQASEAMHSERYEDAYALAISAESRFSDAMIQAVAAPAEAKPRDKEKAAIETPTPSPVKKDKCPEGMVYIAGGSFIMGSASNDPDRNPGEKYNESVSVGPYCIDKYEYPNKKGTLPESNVTWKAADAKCRAAGKRLCTEEEWERACKGPKNLKFPYGQAFDADKCNTEDASGNDRTLAAAGSFACVSGYGVYDLSGNLWEWTSSPLSPGSKDMVLRGGSYTRPDYHDRCANRYNSLPTVTSKEFGFRCCADPNE